MTKGLIVELNEANVRLQSQEIAKAFRTVQNFLLLPTRRHGSAPARKQSILSWGGVGERLKPPVLKTGVHFVHREFESRPLRQGLPRCF